MTIPEIINKIESRISQSEHLRKTDNDFFAAKFEAYSECRDLLKKYLEENTGNEKQELIIDKINFINQNLPLI